MIVPTRDRGELIVDTIRCLTEVDYAHFNVVVVDQSTDDQTAEAVLKIACDDRRITAVRTNTKGSSAGRNLGAHIADSQIVAYTDDDCIVDRAWLKAIVAEFEDPGVAAVYGRLMAYERTRTGREVGYKAAPDRVEYVHRLPPWYIGHGGNMAFRRCDLLAAGGFDPKLGAGGYFGACEDPDIAYRLLVLGKKVVYSPDAIVYHKHWKSWRAQSQMERAYGIGAGAQFAKYIRCGDAYGYRLFLAWMWQLGVRRAASGLLKWRSLKTMYLGYCQLVYPWLGAVKSLGHPIDRRTRVYVDS